MSDTARSDPRLPRGDQPMSACLIPGGRSTGFSRDPRVYSAASEGPNADPPAGPVPLASYTARTNQTKHNNAMLLFCSSSCFPFRWAHNLRESAASRSRLSSTPSCTGVKSLGARAPADHELGVYVPPAPRERLYVPRPARECQPDRSNVRRGCAQSDGCFH